MRKLSLITILGVMLALSAGVAAAATSPNLTTTEYQQLLAFQADTSKPLKTLGSLEAAQKYCRSLSAVSALMRADRTDCKASFDWAAASLEALDRVYLREHGHWPDEDA